MARYQITKDFSAQLNINNVFDKNITVFSRRMAKLL